MPALEEVNLERCDPHHRIVDCGLSPPSSRLATKLPGFIRAIAFSLLVAHASCQEAPLELRGQSEPACLLRDLGLLAGLDRQAVC
jgi:hypothetical protein